MLLNKNEYMNPLYIDKALSYAYWGKSWVLKADSLTSIKLWSNGLDLLCGYYIKSTFNTMVLKALDDQILKLKLRFFSEFWYRKSLIFKLLRPFLNQARIL